MICYCLVSSWWGRHLIKMVIFVHSTTLNALIWDNLAILLLKWTLLARKIQICPAIRLNFAFDLLFLLKHNTSIVDWLGTPVFIKTISILGVGFSCDIFRCPLHHDATTITIIFIILLTPVRIAIQMVVLVLITASYNVRWQVDSGDVFYVFNFNRRCKTSAILTFADLYCTRVCISGR